MINRLDEMMQFQQAALKLREARHELLASNVANADTPNYKARDIDFASALKTALGESNDRLTSERTAAAHLSGNAGTSVMGVPVMYRKPMQPSADGNTVEMDVERAQLTDNALRFEANVRFVSERFKSLLAAVQG